MQATMKAYPSKTHRSSGNLLQRKKKKTNTKTHQNQHKTKKPTKQQTPQPSGPMALEQDSIHSFLLLSASDAALHRHFIFDLAIHAKHSFYSILNKQHLQNFEK